MSRMELVAFLTPLSIPSLTVRKNCIQVSNAHHHFTCSSSSHKQTVPSKDVSIPPSSAKTTGELPATLRGTTILHNIPSTASHLPSSEAPLHPLDGDGYLLAISYQTSGAVWSRGRFVRTKAYMAEAKVQRRIYRGAHGTPGSTGWNAPLKPKASSADGTFLWGRGRKRRVIAFGQRALPIAIDAANLVARGPTALGAVLTESIELASERATEIAAAPVRFGNELFVLGISRTTVGKISGAFIVQIDNDYSVLNRSGRFDLPEGCTVTDFAVSERFCALLLHRESGRGGGVWGALLGRKQSEGSSPVIDKEYGTTVMLISRDGRGVTCCRLAGQIGTKIVDMRYSEGGELRLVCLGLTQIQHKTAENNILRTTLADVASGTAWMEGGGNNWRSTLKDVNISIPAENTKLPKSIDARVSDISHGMGDISILCPAKLANSADTKPTSMIFTIFDHVSTTAGLARIRLIDTEAIMESVWTDSSGAYSLSAPLLSETNDYVSVLASNKDKVSALAARLMIFNVETIDQGCVHGVELDATEFGGIGWSVGGIWQVENVDWNEEGDKPVKSGYEIFDSRKWNDIESGFSSLGIGQ